jgi:hypothetical protein
LAKAIEVCSNKGPGPLPRRVLFKGEILIITKECKNRTGVI